MTLPPLHVNYSMSFPGSPQARSKGIALSSQQLQHHDIDVHELLSEVDLDMYAEVFLVNFGVNDTKYLNRKRLKELRLKDFATMGISQYEHQKILLDHIQHALEFEFKSPVRKNQVRAKMQKRFPGRKFGNDSGEIPISRNIHKLRVEDLHIPEREIKHSKAPGPDNAATTRRRRSFDKNVWQCITHLRTTSKENASAADELRHGHAEALVAIEKKSHEHRRRRSFDHAQSGIAFGNRALSADLIHKELHQLQSLHMKRLRKLLGCKEAYVMFLHGPSHDLLLVTEHAVWYRMPIGFSLMGHCAENGSIVNAQQVYEDINFNSNLDDKLGIVSKEVLCYPLRGNRGAGAVIGVIMGVNKDGGFDHNDEETIATIAQNIADDLMSKFVELTTIADIMYGSAIAIHVQGGQLGTRRRDGKGKSVLETGSLNRPTKASEAQRTHAYESDYGLSGKDVHSVHGPAMHM